MKIAFPLSLKVSLWLLLNLLLLATAGAAFFLAQFGFGWESLASGAAGDRVQAIGDVIMAELTQNPAAKPDAVLARFGAAYGIELMLFRNDGSQYAGRRAELPPEVRSSLTALRDPGTSPTLGRPPGVGGPPEMLRQPPPGGNPPDLRAPPDSRYGPERTSQSGRTRFFLRTLAPTRYWIGLRLMLPSGDGARRAPGMLVASSDSLAGAGLLFDLKAWIFGAVAVALLSILFWLPLVRSMTRTIGRLTAATEQIADGRFETRVATDRSDEIGRLGEAINGMAGRLDGFVRGQRRFLADVAHELGSPLARLQFATGILEELADPALQRAVADVREEVQQMAGLVNELLAFTKAGLSSRDARLETVALAPLVARVLDREAAGARIVASVPEGLSVSAEPDLLARALANLVRNALRHAAEAGPITLTAVPGAAGTVLVTVADEGPGVPPGDLAQLGEPFYRPEAARTRETGGAGLGLAIVKSAVDACRGKVRFGNRLPRGFVAEIALQAAPPAGPAS